MPKYKITASKSQKKYVFVFNAENDRLARERIHKEGYSILTVELFQDKNLGDNVFIFKGEKKGEVKSGKVVGKDIFKIYLKLRDGVGYKILELYPKRDENKPEDYKKNVLKELEEQYDFFYKNIKKDKIKKKEEKKEDKNEINSDGFYLQKELEQTYKLIDFVLAKTKNLFENKDLDIDEEKKEKLKNLYNSLIKLKSSTNIIKLKKIGEKVLEKIGEIELENIDKKKKVDAKKYLKETNKLLKEIGSDKKFVPKDEDFVLKIKNFVKFLKETLKNEYEKKKGKKKVKKIEEASYSDLKNRILLNKYKEKYKQNLIEIIKNFYIFLIPIKKFEEKRTKLILKKQVISQNIYLLKNKLDKINFSYTKALKGFDYILEKIFKFFIFIRDYLFLVVFFYSLLFLIFINLNYHKIIDSGDLINYRGIFYFIMFIFIYFAIYFSRGVKTLILNFTILFFVFYFGIINF